MSESILDRAIRELAIYAHLKIATGEAVIQYARTLEARLEDQKARCFRAKQQFREWPEWIAMEAELEQTKRERDEWKNAVIDAAVVNWVYTKEHESDPRKAINDLLAWQRELADLKGEKE